MYDEHPCPFSYGSPSPPPPQALWFHFLHFRTISRLSSQSLHWRNESISFLRWVPGVHGAPVHQPMASAARALSIKHVTLPRHLTAALRVQRRSKLARAHTVVVLLIAWHPRGLHGVLAPTPVVRVSIRELNIDHSLEGESKSDRTGEKIETFPSSFAVSLTLSCNPEYCIVTSGSNKLHCIWNVIGSSRNNTLELLSHSNQGWFFFLLSLSIHWQVNRI